MNTRRAIDAKSTNDVANPNERQDKGILMGIERFDPKDPDDRERMRVFLSPQQVDHQIRQAIQFCWMALPDEKRSVEEVEKQIRRIVDRALRDLRDDAASFAVGGE